MTSPTIVQEDQIAVVVCHLNIWRKAIQSYRRDHGQWPGWNEPDAFVGQITGCTNNKGEVGNGKAYTFGPYLDGTDLPINPITETSDVLVVEEWPGQDAGKNAWVYNCHNGEFRVNSTGITTDGEKIFNF